METSLKTGFAQIFSCCPKNLSRPKFGGAAAPLAPSARTPMNIEQGKTLTASKRIDERPTPRQRVSDKSPPPGQTR